MKIAKRIGIGLLIIIMVVFIPFFELIAALLLRFTMMALILGICLYLLRALYIAFKAIRTGEVITMQKLFNIGLRKTTTTATKMKAGSGRE